MSKPTYFFSVSVPKRPRISGREMEREDFYSWIWSHYLSRGLLGVHEGTLLTEQATQQGLETESWTVDSGEAPQERDWISNQSLESAVFYFETEKQAKAAAIELANEAGLKPGPVKIQKPQDWDAEWKASFRGISIAPFWEVRPPWVDEKIPDGKKLLRLNPGAGFGTGTHETTQLCLRALGEISREFPISGKRALDFGSGSGILSIAAALLGAQVDAVEIDPLAQENALENARLSRVEERIHFFRELPENSEPYPLILANILRPVLIEFAPKLVSRCAEHGSLILSGLIESDVPEIRRVYGELLKTSRPPQTVSLNEWRALIFYL